MFKNLRPILCSLKYYYWDRQKHTIKYHIIALALFIILLPAFFQGITWLKEYPFFNTLSQKKLYLTIDGLLRPLLFLYFFVFFYIVQKDARIKIFYFMLYVLSLVLAYKMLKRSGDIFWISISILSQLVLVSLSYTAFQITEMCEFRDIKTRNSSLVHWSLFSIPLLAIILFTGFIYWLA